MTIGCDYTLCEHNRLLACQWGQAVLEDNRIAVTMVVAGVVMQSALERGIDEYDYLTYDIFYKGQLSTRAEVLILARTTRGTRINVIHKLAEARRKVFQLLPFRAESSSIAGKGHITIKSGQ
jgi:hypothetical protein